MWPYNIHSRSYLHGNKWAAYCTLVPLFQLCHGWKQEHVTCNWCDNLHHSSHPIHAMNNSELFEIIHVNLVPAVWCKYLYWFWIEGEYNTCLLCDSLQKTQDENMRIINFWRRQMIHSDPTHNDVKSLSAFISHNLHIHMLWCHVIEFHQ